MVPSASSSASDTWRRAPAASRWRSRRGMSLITSTSRSSLVAPACITRRMYVRSCCITSTPCTPSMTEKKAMRRCSRSGAKTTTTSERSASESDALPLPWPPLPPPLPPPCRRRRRRRRPSTAAAGRALKVQRGAPSSVGGSWSTTTQSVPAGAERSSTSSRSSVPSALACMPPPCVSCRATTPAESSCAWMWRISRSAGVRSVARAAQRHAHLVLHLVRRRRRREAGEAGGAVGDDDDDGDGAPGRRRRRRSTCRPRRGVAAHHSRHVARGGLVEARRRRHLARRAPIQLGRRVRLAIGDDAAAVATPRRGRGPAIAVVDRLQRRDRLARRRHV